MKPFLLCFSQAIALIVVMDRWGFLLVGVPPTLSASVIFPQGPSILSTQDSIS